jgi:hypothetical protein
MEMEAAPFDRRPLLWEDGYKDITMATSIADRRSFKISHHPSLAEQCSTGHSH